MTLYIADTFNNVVREVNLPTGIITTVAGTGTAGYSGDNGPATAAELYDPSGVAVDSAGNLYIADSDNEVVREVTASTQVITTIAGTGTYGYSGDNGPATSAELGTPSGLALNSAGTVLYIADRDNNAIRAVDLTTGIITTVAGNGTFGPSGDNGPATSAALSSPRSIAVDASGNLYIADTLGNEIRMVAAGIGTASVTVTPFASIAPGYNTVYANKRAYRCRSPEGPGDRSRPRQRHQSDYGLAGKSSYVLSTPANRGKFKMIGIHRVNFDATTDVVSIFPSTALNATQDLSAHHLMVRQAVRWRCSSTRRVSSRKKRFTGGDPRHEGAGPAFGPAQAESAFAPRSLLS